MTLRYGPIQYLPMGSCTIGTMEPREDGEWVNYNAYAEALDAIEELEIRHAATMLHTQTIVNEANTTRQQRDRLAKALEFILKLEDDSEAAMQAIGVPKENEEHPIITDAREALAAINPQPTEP